ncbi:MAG: HAMP domain-containing protein [Betaproteobacteria bacterium]|nr:HAMP domain-containing protein [Betaproteobacteria bacterium]
MMTILSNLTIKTKVITCAVIGFAMMIATALTMFWSDAAIVEAMEGGSRLRDQLVAQLREDAARSGVPGVAASGATQAASERIAREIAAADSAVLEAKRTATIAFAAVSTAGMVVFALLALWIIVSVLKPVFAAMQVVRTIAGGDLTTRIEVASRDETGQLLAALREMNDSLAGTVARVRRSADTVHAATRSLVAGNSDLSREAEQQAVSLEEAASATEQMSASVSVHADSAREASQLAQTAALLAQDGGEMVDNVAGKMATVQASSSRISEIVTLIDGIAFQTNILALNAAVEAARAGEEGRGFAVVASEVRSLAQRSAAAARDIRGVIGESLEMIRSASAQAGEAGAKMLEIVESTGEVRDLMDRIASASREQSAGLSQVATVVGHLDNATQRYSHVVAQLSAATDATGRQADELVAAASAFRIGDEEAGGQVEIERMPAGSRAVRHAPAAPALTVTRGLREGRTRF